MLGWHQSANLGIEPGTAACEAMILIFCPSCLQWDLVCNRIALKSTVQMAVALGKFLGALLFGFVADR